MSSFMDKVQAVENKFMDLEQQISDPSVIARQDEWQKLTKEHASLMPIVETLRKYKDITSTIDGDKEIIDDPDSDDDLIAIHEIRDAPRLAVTLDDGMVVEHLRHVSANWHRPRTRLSEHGIGDLGPDSA